MLTLLRALPSDSESVTSSLLFCVGVNPKAFLGKVSMDCFSDPFSISTKSDIFIASSVWVITVTSLK